MKACVVGVGNRFRRDDGIGIVLLDLLKQELGEHCDFHEHSGEGASLMALWQGYEAVFLIDAVAVGQQPGQLYILDAQQRQIPSEFFHYSTHAFSVAEAVEMARALNDLPESLIIYGIEGVDFGYATTLSHELQQLLPQLKKSIASHIRRQLEIE